MGKEKNKNEQNKESVSLKHGLDPAPTVRQQRKKNFWTIKRRNGHQIKNGKPKINFADYKSHANEISNERARNTCGD